MGGEEGRCPISDQFIGVLFNNEQGTRWRGGYWVWMTCFLPLSPPPHMGLDVHVGRTEGRQDPPPLAKTELFRREQRRLGGLSLSGCSVVAERAGAQRAGGVCASDVTLDVTRHQTWWAVVSRE